MSWVGKVQVGNLKLPMENMDNNTAVQDLDNIESYEFKYNFINIPWDDRNKRSKVGIILLLVSIFVATLICIINSFYMLYRHSGKTCGHFDTNVAVNCQVVKVDDHLYVARIHSMTTNEMLCVGAVVSKNSVLANGACVMNGQVRIYVGNVNNHRCKKGFAVNVAEPIVYKGVVVKTLVLLFTYENMEGCVQVIQTRSRAVEDKSGAYVIGRLIHSTKSTRTLLSRQPVTVLTAGCVCQGGTNKGKDNYPSAICAESLARCPLLAGDLLTQGDTVIGIALTSVYPKGTETSHAQVCFANLSFL